MASNASSSSTSESVSSESPQNTLPNEKSLLDRMAKLRENKQKIFSTLCKVKSEMKDDEEFDKTLMTELRDNYNMLCAQEDEFLKVMQNRKLCQMANRNAAKRSDLALLNMCISILEIRQLQDVNVGLAGTSFLNTATQAYVSQHANLPVSDQLETIRKNKEKIQRTLKNLEDNAEIDEDLQGRMLAEITADYYMLRAQETECSKQNQKEKHNVEYLKRLREEKRRVILVLRSLRENLSEDDEVDKTLVAEMLAKYDMLSFQEEEFSRPSRNAEGSYHPTPEKPQGDVENTISNDAKDPK